MAKHVVLYASEIYQYCRCGAVRMRVPEKPGIWQDWHVCKLCSTGLSCADPEVANG